ncbi:transposase [Methylorubrum populi]|uniref:Transposase n=1 Tax=Methylorubrum populi TaxID=223967 RepID=A0A160PK47_9HYPH|nr:hypothetical protein [Methylorubrum populi]BAU93446.1 transposase [Methylorubrum populi]
MTLTSETRAPVGTREAPKLNGKERRLLSGMACGGLLYVYVDADGGVDGGPLHAGWPRPGTGAVVYDGPPTPVTARFVRRLRRLGSYWDHSAGAEMLTARGRAKARALLGGRDILFVASPLPANESQKEGAAV